MNQMLIYYRKHSEFAFSKLFKLLIVDTVRLRLMRERILMTLYFMV